MAGIIIDGEMAIKFVAPMSVISNQPAFSSDALNLRQQVASQKAQRWEITTNLMPSNDSADFLVHSVTRGYGNVFEIETPQVYRGPNKSTATRVDTVQNALRGADRVQVSMAGTILKGEFIQFTGHPKVYLVTKALTGAGELQIYPQLLQPVPVGARIKLDKDCWMQVRHAPETALGITYVDGIMSDPGSIKLVEAL